MTPIIQANQSRSNTSKISQLKIAIIGYGKMGKEVEKFLKDSSIMEIVIIDNEEDWITKKDQFLQCKIAIEFTTPETAVENITRCIENRIPIVSGTTGWHSHLPDLIQKAENDATSFIYGTNFSIGANLFFDLNRFLATKLQHIPQYDINIEETHHLQKIDKPSGTAITLAEFFLQKMDRKTSWQLVEDNATAASKIEAAATNKNEILLINSVREGNVSGIHQVTCESEEDLIQLSHIAKNRSGFAYGAVKAAFWLVNNPGIYHFADIYGHI